LNEHYARIHDIQTEGAAVLEGIRILNARVEEYDKRIDALQEATDKFFSQVQAETTQRDTVISQALDALHEKFLTEVSAKLENPNSPNAFASPQVMSPRLPFLPTPSPANSGVLSQINAQLDNQAKLINDLHARVRTVHAEVLATQSANTGLQTRVAQFCDEVSTRLSVYQRDQATVGTKVQAAELATRTIHAPLARHVANTENNFKETAVFMDTVKRRFGEHRKQLDNLITASTETMASTDQLTGKFESLKEFISNRIVPTIAKMQQSLPAGSAETGNNALNSPNVTTAPRDSTPRRALHNPIQK
jgi:cell division septation protein DedD